MRSRFRESEATGQFSDEGESVTDSEVKRGGFEEESFKGDNFPRGIIKERGVGSYWITTERWEVERCGEDLAGLDKCVGEFAGEEEGGGGCFSPRV